MSEFLYDFSMERGFAPRSNAVIQVCNSSRDFTLKALHPAKIIGGYGQSIDSAAAVFEVRPADSLSLYWGIICQDLPPGRCGSMIISGITPAIVKYNRDLALQTVAPADDGELTFAYSGRGELIDFNNNGGPDMIYLGNMSGRDILTSFKIAIERNRWKVYDGYAPESGFCGKSDIPGCTNVPAVSGALPASGFCSIYAWFRCSDGEKLYEVGVGPQVPENTLAHITIGNLQYFPETGIKYVNQHFIGQTIRLSHGWWL